MRITEDIGGIFRDNLQKGRPVHFTKKIWETRSNDQRHESGRLKHADSKERD